MRARLHHLGPAEIGRYLDSVHDDSAKYQGEESQVGQECACRTYREPALGARGRSSSLIPESRETLLNRRLTSGRSAAGPLTGWLEAPDSMPDSTMDRLDCAVAGQLRRLVRWLVAWRTL
jgi:hypothetical protein